jgi:hypothetical protein
MRLPSRHPAEISLPFPMSFGLFHDLLLIHLKVSLKHNETYRASARPQTEPPFLQVILIELCRQLGLISISVNRLN